MTSLQELFDKDPLQLSDRELNLLVQEMRREYSQYVEARAKAPKGKKVMAPEAAKMTVDKLGIKL